MAKLKYCSKTQFLLPLLSFLFFSIKTQAQGNLFINPKRVVLEGQKRFTTIDLANIGNDTAKYSISFIQIRMKKDGNFEEIQQPDSGQYFADKYLRIFPRQVTLAPKEAQVVKVQVSQASKLPPGEYRSHLYFRALPDEKPLGAKQTAKSEGLSVRLTPVFGISIPVILRSGETSASVNISNLKLDSTSASNPSPMLRASLNRAGNRSAYGDILVEHISPAGKIKKAAQMKGVSVYTPNARRDLNLILDNKAGINYKAGKLRITYSTPPDEKSQLLAEAEFAL